MKRLLLTYLLVFLAQGFYAQVWARERKVRSFITDTTVVKDYNPHIDRHLASAITCINQGNFESAKDSLLLVNDWQFCPLDSIGRKPRIEGDLHGFSRPDTIMYKYPYYLWTWDSCRIEIIHPERMHQFIAFKEKVPVPPYAWRRLMRYYRQQIYFLQDNIRGWYRERSLFMYYFQELCWVHDELEEEDNLEYARLLYHAGNCAHDYHYYYIALRYLEEAYKISSLYSKKSNYSVYSALLLGDIYSEFGNYEKTDYYLHCALLNAKHISTSLTHYLLGNHFLALGDSQLAETHYKKSLQIAKKQKDNELCRHSLYGLIYIYYFYEQDIEKAIDYSRMLSKFRIIKEKNYSSYYFLKDRILSKNNIQGLYAYPILIDLNLDIDSITYVLSLGLGYDQPTLEHIQNCNLLGACYIQKGEYVEAKQHLEKARELAEQAIQNREMGSHQEYAKTLSSMIQVYTAMGLPELAKPILWESVKEHKDRYLESLSFLTARQRDLYWDKIQPDFMNLYPAFEYRNYPQWPELAEIAYDNELFTKGLLLTSSDAVRRSVLSSGDTVLIAQWEELTAIRQAIKAMQERMTDMERIDEYEKRAEELEKIITVNSAAYRENMQQWSITWDSVRKALKPQQVAIEYMSAPINENSTMYCALLLRDTCSQPILIPLFEQKEVDSLLERYTDTVYLAIRRIYAYDERGKALSERIWNNVKPYLHTGDTVYFSATGLLHQIAIENLWYDSTHTMADTYTMVRLSSTRELAIHRAPIAYQTATIYGDIYYEETPEMMLAVVQKMKRDNSVSYLPGTKVEIANIQAILKKQHIHVQSYSHFAANEESFKALSGKHQNIIHLATHGFYQADTTFNNPLERCGLYFSGANNVLKGHKDRLINLNESLNDGIVTAKDISLMDLRGADIVVLSACETGLGDVTGEGVFGLQRALKMAGVQTLVMSLWKVDDQATQRLMTAFYNYLCTHGMTKRQAFRAAQQEVRNSGFESPYYWAGFILLD